MKQTGKLDYLEMPATGGTLDSVKAFYSAAFGWTFTDYGPTYSAFEEGLDGGFHSDSSQVLPKPLPVLYSEDIEATRRWNQPAAGSQSRSTPFPAAGGFISSTPPATSSRCGESDAAEWFDEQGHPFDDCLRSFGAIVLFKDAVIRPPCLPCIGA
jgi:predicted enzyme related to lactoylglutathione lyase